MLIKVHMYFLKIKEMEMIKLINVICIYYTILNFLRKEEEPWKISIGGL